MIVAIDPGNEQSAYVLLDGDRVVEHDKLDNAEMLQRIDRLSRASKNNCVVEMVASYGMAVGREVFETVYWIGRFCERWDSDCVAMLRNTAQRLVRRDVKMHLCGNNAAKDANLRAALLDRFGPGKERAVGTKKQPGPLYGISGDEWQALALAVTFRDLHVRKEEQHA